MSHDDTIEEITEEVSEEASEEAADLNEAFGGISGSALLDSTKRYAEGVITGELLSGLNEGGREAASLGEGLARDLLPSFAPSMHRMLGAMVATNLQSFATRHGRTIPDISHVSADQILSENRAFSGQGVERTPSGVAADAEE